MEIHSAVDIETDSGQIPSALPCEECGGEPDVADFPESERNRFRQFGDALRAVSLEKQLRFDDSRGERVDRDMIGSSGSGERACHTENTGLVAA